MIKIKGATPHRCKIAGRSQDTMSMVSRVTLKKIARFALAGFLFIQGAVAAAGCDLGGYSAAQAILNASAADDHACHQEDQSTATLCVAHCVTQTQSLDKPFWKAPAPAAAPVAVVLVPGSLAAVPAPTFDLPLALAGPPRRILYRTLLI